MLHPRFAQWQLIQDSTPTNHVWHWFVFARVFYSHSSTGFTRGARSALFFSHHHGQTVNSRSSKVEQQRTGLSVLALEVGATGGRGRGSGAEAEETSLCDRTSNDRLLSADTNHSTKPNQSTNIATLGATEEGAGVRGGDATHIIALSFQRSRCMHTLDAVLDS